MAFKEKTYILKHSPDGLKLFRDREADQPDIEFGAEAPPDKDILVPPRWDHWYQRKLARPWQATLLGMNFEPVPESRRALKAHEPEKYQIFRDRLDIVQTLLGYEIGFFEDHVREGDGANGKYIELAEYTRYAESLGWDGLGPMRTGLQLDKKPPILRESQRQTDNLLRVLDLTFLNSVPNYFNDKGERSSTAVMKWFADRDTKLPIGDGALRNWFSLIVDLKNKGTDEPMSDSS